MISEASLLGTGRVGLEEQRQAALPPPLANEFMPTVGGRAGGRRAALLRRVSITRPALLSNTCLDRAGWQRPASGRGCSCVGRCVGGWEAELEPPTPTSHLFLRLRGSVCHSE